MVTSCSAYNCSSRHKKESGISFYTFPRDPVMRKKWIIAMKRKNFEPTYSSRVCSKHFTPDQYQIRPNCNFELLKPDSVPSVFEFSSELTHPSCRKKELINGAQPHESGLRNHEVPLAKVAGTAPTTPTQLHVLCISAKFSVSNLVRWDPKFYSGSHADGIRHLIGQRVM
ncbi:unnamed protein product [Nezara viridula]|uniref:THAP-type domain-containing protein n=1 Tax=Nezara viridula TaxID=85310 RepID=A0A9P0H6F3_NEZVI|nr:unnamed protein product [Nezara viridula]